MVSTRAERVAKRVAFVAMMWFALAAGWEIAGPLPGGHLGNAAGAAVAGDNMVRHRLFAAVLDYVARAPTPADYYTHHPYGVFVDEAIAHVLVGHHWATVRLPALVFSAFSPLFVYLTARALWGVVPAAVATVAFTVIPIDVAFSDFHNLEGDVIFWGLVYSWATARLFQSWRPRFLIPTAFGALGACQSDWVGMVLVGVIGSLAFVRAYLLPSRWFSPVHHREHARWFALSTAAAVGTLLLYLVLFAKAGKLADLLSSYQSRTAGNEAPLEQVFVQRRSMWFLWMLPWIAVVAMGLGTVAHIARTLLRTTCGSGFPSRRFEEVIPLAWLAAASFQYFVFRQGADVHIFWPHYYGVVAAFAFGVLARVSLDVSVRLPLRSDLATTAVLAPIAISLVLLLRIAVPQLRQSHLTGGRFDDGGRFIAIDQDRSTFAAWVGRTVPKDASVGAHHSFYPHWYIEYGVNRPMPHLASLSHVAPSDPARIAVVDTTQTNPGELRVIATQTSIQAVGPFWRVDRAAPPSFVALRYEERQPRFFERYFLTGVDLVHEVGDTPDPFATWEWQDHLGLTASAELPPPATAEEARIAYDAARARGDDSAARVLRAKAESLIDRRMDVAFSGDVRLIGVRVDDGAATVVTLLWETGPAFVASDLDFLVRSHVERAPALWFAPIDYFEKEVAPRMSLRPGLWKPGRLYVQRFVAMKRVGTERFEGYWVSNAGTRPPLPASGKERVELFTLE